MKKNYSFVKEKPTKFVEFKRSQFSNWYAIIEKKGSSRVVTHTCKLRKEAEDYFKALAEKDGAMLSYVRKLR
ncbi:hypothetical protein P8825_14275 [Shouchella clausii]|uniref:hypothetical protein n=1 Tax=Shouchella clausii TaxID=79880 RepID=UPI002DBF462E|nr:hypothetical protein [Shouchella clausii]MEB5480730.1 hypothetical protein [Shouchella clausii]